MSDIEGIAGLDPVATFCGNCDCGLTDDFGQRVQMSADQFSSLVAEAKSGKLDGLATN
ncbi:hypothetical protein AB0N62_05415 [Streptomyces sp. NPDC093982]|uniref:hypothetical protein n=1 Tax=Streptomyces sp. NPDC093982 TaxID=3155077 RepID=UPI0034142963